MPYYMYVSISGENRILVFTVDSETGRLESQGDVAVTGSPAPLAIDPGRRFLYVGCLGTREISSYRINWSTGGLSLVGTASLKADPCYLATDRKGRFLLSAYYDAGKVAIHPIGDDGAVGTPPVEWLDTARGAHSIQTDPSNRFAFVPHIAAPDGPNVILQFKFNKTTGRLTPNSPHRVIPEESAGCHFDISSQTLYPDRDAITPGIGLPYPIHVFRAAKISPKVSLIIRTSTFA